jgi:hypothetical protein
MHLPHLQLIHREAHKVAHCRCELCHCETPIGARFDCCTDCTQGQHYGEVNSTPAILKRA